MIKLRMNQLIDNAVKYKNAMESEGLEIPNSTFLPNRSVDSMIVSDYRAFKSDYTATSFERENRNNSAYTAYIYQEMGITLLGDVGNYYKAVLPTDWRVESFRNEMCEGDPIINMLVDSNSNIRGVFELEADDAVISFNCFYRIAFVVSAFGDTEELAVRGINYKNDEPLVAFENIGSLNHSDEFKSNIEVLLDELLSKTEAQCIDWFKGMNIQYNDPLTYWDSNPIK